MFMLQRFALKITLTLASYLQMCDEFVHVIVFFLLCEALCDYSFCLFFFKNHEYISFHE